MIKESLLSVHSVDLKDETCEICGKKIYPALFCSVLGRWRFKYVCIGCAAKFGKVSEKRVKEIAENFINGYRCLDYIDSSWVDDTDKAKILEEFIKIEEEDLGFIHNDELWKAHIFCEHLKTGHVVFSEDEMFNYFNFYGNIPELVFTLRGLLLAGNNSRFLRDMYYKARTRRLTRRQVGVIKNDKAFRGYRNS